MNQTKVRSSSLFLMELIISILFFAVAAAFCVQFIVKSHTISSNAENLASASVECSSVAELIYASDSPAEIVIEVAAVWPEAEFQGSQIAAYPATTADSSPDSAADFTIYFDSDWEPCSSEDAVYALQTDITYENNMMQGTISAVSAVDGDAIYSLDIKHYVQKEVSK